MNLKTTLFLFGVLALLVVVLAVVLVYNPSTGSDTHYVLASMHDKANPFKPDDVDKVVIERKKPADATMVFERDPDTRKWRITEPRKLAADNNNIDRLINEVYNADRDEESKPESLKKGGLEEPQRIITLSAEGREVKLTIGEVMPSDLAYVASSDAPREAQAVRKSSIEAALENLPFFRNKDLLGEGPATDLQVVKVSQGKKTVELKKDKDHWRLVQPPYGEADLGTLLNNLSDLRVPYRSDKDNGFVADGVTDLAKYHLDPAKDDVLRIEVQRGEEGKTKTHAIHVGVSKKVAGPDKKEDRYYAYADTDAKGKDIVQVEASKVEPFVKLVDDPGAYREKTLVKIDNFRTPDAIDVENSYRKLEFRRPDPAKPWELFRGDQAKGANVEDAEIQALLSALTGKDQVKEFPDPKRKAELGLGKDKADYTVSVYVDSLEKPEKKDEKKDKKEEKKDEAKKEEKSAEKKEGKPALKKDVKPVATLRFGNREKGLVAVERTVGGGESTLVMVPESVLDLVKRGPLAYVDKTLPQFARGVNAAQDVTKVVLERKGTTYEITHEKSGAPWKLTKPANLAGRDANANAVEDILNDLNNLKAVQIAAEKATPEELGRNYDLKSPPYRVTITTKEDGKEATHEYLIGKESSDKRGYYLKLGDRDTIYVAGHNIISALDRDLQDPTIFNFATDKVQSVTLRGWKKLVGRATSLTFEKKDGKWVAKDPPDYNLDTAKLEDFLQKLSHLQAVKFVPSGKEKELTLNENAFEVEIKVEGKPEALQLMVGGEEGGSYFATSKQLKGDVFLVRKDIFEGPRGAPGYFSK